MPVSNTNKPMLDRPSWEQLTFCPVGGSNGTCITDDGSRYIYSYIQATTTSSTFWRYDTWSDTWQQLATPATQTGSVASIVYTLAHGAVFSGKIYGTVWLLIGNGTTAYFYKYSIVTNTWVAMSVATIPRTFAGDVSLLYPSVSKNGYLTAYHSGVTRTITTSAVATVAATTVSVAALPEALAADTILRFGTFNVTITNAASKGAVALTVSALPQAMAAGTILYTTGGQEYCLSAPAAAAATTLVVYPINRSIAASTVIRVEQHAVLTVAAAASATSITVSPLLVSIGSGVTAGYYANMYLVGNSATQMYRYNIPTNTWLLTSANTANPAIPAIPAAVGTGLALKWLPVYAPDKLWLIRGAATATVYIYDLITNAWTTESYLPNTEGFSTGSCAATREINGRGASLLIQKDGTGRIYEGVPYRNTLDPCITQWLYPGSTAVVGDRACVMTSPDGIDFYYMLLHSSTAFLRCALIDS